MTHEPSAQAELESGLTLLNKKYHGFEAASDIDRDVSEIFEFPEDARFKNVIGEFQGTIEILIKFHPEPGDLKND